MSTRFEVDLVERAIWIGERNPEAAERFIDAVESALAMLEENTELGVRRKMKDPRLAEVRIWPITEFPNYLILYLPAKEGGVLPLRLVHGAMDYRKDRDLFDRDDPESDG